MNKEYILRNSQIVEVRNGQLFFVMDNGNVLVGSKNFCYASHYNDELEFATSSELDIVRAWRLNDKSVYDSLDIMTSDSYKRVLEAYLDDKTAKIIYEREEVHLKGKMVYQLQVDIHGGTPQYYIYESETDAIEKLEREFKNEVDAIDDADLEILFKTQSDRYALVRYAYHDEVCVSVFRIKKREIL